MLHQAFTPIRATIANNRATIGTKTTPDMPVCRSNVIMENYAPQKLTEGLVKRLPLNGQAYFVRDLAVTGLLVAVNKSTKSHKVQRDLWRGQRGRRRLIKTVRHTLGTIDELTLDDARTRAQEVIAQIKRGVNPNEPEPTETAGTWILAGEAPTGGLKLVTPAYHKEHNLRLGQRVACP
jgi:hypothetical protein